LGRRLLQQNPPEAVVAAARSAFDRVPEVSA
jgi:hypothetical protein